MSEDERADEHPEAHRCRHERDGECERDSPNEDHESSSPGVAEYADEWIDDAADEARDGEGKPNLGVGQAEVVTNERPGRTERAVDELVEELDREQQADDAGKSAPAKGAGLTRRSSAVHGRKCMHRAGQIKSVKSLRLRDAIARAP